MILPQLSPGILGGALLACVILLNDLAITYIVAGIGSTPLSLFIFGMIRRAGETRE